MATATELKPKLALPRLTQATDRTALKGLYTKYKIPVKQTIRGTNSASSGDSGIQDMKRSALRSKKVVLPKLKRVSFLVHEDNDRDYGNIRSASKKRGSNLSALPVSINQNGNNLVRNSRYTLYNYKGTRDKDRRPKAATLGGRNHSVPDQRIQQKGTPGRTSSAPYRTDDQEEPSLPKLNNLVPERKVRHSDKETGKSTNSKEKGKFASSWKEFRSETVEKENSNSSPNEPAAAEESSAKANLKSETSENKTHSTESSSHDKNVQPRKSASKQIDENKSSKNKAVISSSDKIGLSTKPNTNSEVIVSEKVGVNKSNLKDKETTSSKTNEHVKFSESNKPASLSKDSVRTNKVQTQNINKRIGIEKTTKQKDTSYGYKQKTDKPKRQPISWRPREKSSSHDENNNRMLSENSDKPSMFGKPSGFSFSYTAGRKKADSVNNKPNSSSKVSNTPGGFPKRPSLLRHRERSRPLLPQGLTQYSLKTRQDYITAAREIRQPKTVYAKETKKYLESRSRAGSRASLVSVGTNRGGAKSTASSIYSKTTKSMMPPWRKNGYTLTQREGAAYRSINFIYGAQTLKSKFQRQRQFYNKLEQVQLEEIRTFNSSIRQEQLKKQQKKVQQQKELKRLRDQFNEDRDRRFRNQYVTSRLLEHEREPTSNEYGLPDKLSSAKQNHKNVKPLKPVSRFDKTANMVKNYKKYSSLFQLHGGPSWDSSSSAPRMEGVDDVKLQITDESGNSVEKKFDVKKLLDSAQDMLNIPGPDDDVKSVNKDNADNLSLDSLNLDDDLFEKARKKYGLTVDD